MKTRVMTGVRNIIFDFDGTLADTAPLIIATMQAANRALGLPERTDAQCRAMIGLRLEEIPGTLWPELPDMSAEYARTYRRLFEELKGDCPAVCFDGVADTLGVLHRMGFRLAIASSRSHRSLDEYVAAFGFDGLFSLVVGGNDVARGKPAPDPVLAIADRLGWNVAETLVVGDATFDIDMGRNAGALTCGVTYGNQTRAQLATSCPDALIDTFASLLPIVCGVRPEIVRHVESVILPRYDGFDKAHRRDHADKVIEQSMLLADRFRDADRDMVYVTAAYHDLGLVNGRERHHIDSGMILRSDPFIARHFTPGQVETMAEAVEDHRASGKSEPRSIYGLMVAEADRFIDADTIIRRTIQYGLSHYPELDRQGHYERTVCHLEEKYGPDGYLRVWIPESENARNLAALRAMMADRERMAEAFGRIFDEETRPD